MQRYGIIQKNDERSYQVAKTIRDTLNLAGWEESDAPQLVFAVGGDGTFLVAVHEYLEQLNEIQIIGIHTGTLGFMTDYEADEVDLMLHDVLNKESKIDELRLLQIENDKGETYYALNEVRVENLFKTQIMDIEIDGEFFETYRGTGICVSTQMGSTAYNRSIHGAVIQHGLPLLEVSEIAGIHHREFQSLASSIILKEDVQIEFKSDSFEGAVMLYDYKAASLNDVKWIRCFNSDKTVKIARYRPYRYISRLKNLF